MVSDIYGNFNHFLPLKFDTKNQGSFKEFNIIDNK